MSNWWTFDCFLDNRMILARYILREFLGNWLAVALSVSVLVLGSQLTRALDRAAEANLPSDVVLKLTLLTFLQTAQITMPLALLLAVVLTYGRLAHDGEMSAIRSSGMSAWRSARGILIFGLLSALVLGSITLYTAPQMALREQLTLSEAFRRSQLAAFEPGRFTQLPGTSLVVHVGAADANGELRDVLFLQRDGKSLEVIRAQRATYQLDAAVRNLALHLVDGERLTGEAGAAASERIRFQSLDLTVPLPTVERSRASRDVLSTADLLASPRLDDQAELQWRGSVPLMCLLLMMVAVPLSQLRPRQGRYTRMAPALLIFFLYVNLLAAMRSSIARGTFPLRPGMWAVHSGVAAAALLWFTRKRWRRVASSA
jgi:lipopolysaccharide export system permease protein